MKAAGFGLHRLQASGSSGSARIGIGRIDETSRSQKTRVYRETPGLHPEVPKPAARSPQPEVCNPQPQACRLQPTCSLKPAASTSLLSAALHRHAAFLVALMTAAMPFNAILRA